MIPPPTPRKPLTLLVLVYGGLLLYASLMPYDFTTAVDWRRLLCFEVWNHWPFDPRARLSGSDLVSNLALYIPLSLLLATWGRFTRRSPLAIFILTVLLCSSLSMGIEILQGMTVSRTPSATDWLLNTLSGMLGAFMGAGWGKPWWENSAAWLRRRWQNRPLDVLTLVVAGLLAADALAPFLPTILLSQVWRNLKNSHFDLIEGLAQHPWHWWLTTRVLVFMLLTCLLAAWGRPATRARQWRKAALMATALAVGLELAKPLIVSRSLNLATVAASTAGAGLALIIGPRLRGRLSQRRQQDLAILVLLGYGFSLAWTPFDFTWDLERLRQKLPTPVELLPFYHYAMGASLNHARLFLQAIALQGILVYLLRMRWPSFAASRWRLVLALLLAGLVGLLQEGGQLLLPQRTPSMTDVYCFMIGGAIGSWLPGKRPTSEETS